jgi:hypothetical protein
MAGHLDAQVAAFRERPLDAGPYTFIWVDALTVKVREDGRVVGVHALIATAVNADGHREILGLDVASAEDGAGWLAFLRGLVARGLSGVQLVISDAHPGLVAAIGAALPGASWQRCRTHWSRKRSTRRLLGVRCAGCWHGGEEGCCGGESGPGYRRGHVAVLFQEWADFEQGRADRARADVEQVCEDLSGADPALVEHGRQDPFRIGDLLQEDAAAGSGQSFCAAAAVAAPLDLGRLLNGQSLDHLGQLGPGHAGQGGIGEHLGHARPRGCDAVFEEVGEGARGRETQRGR